MQRLRHPEQRGNPFVVGRERILERLGRLGVVVRLQEQLAPARVKRRIVRRLFGRDAVRVVGELKFAERAGGAAEARVLGRRRARADLHVGDALAAARAIRRGAPSSRRTDPARAPLRRSGVRAASGFSSASASAYWPRLMAARALTTVGSVAPCAYAMRLVRPSDTVPTASATARRRNTAPRQKPGLSWRRLSIMLRSSRDFRDCHRRDRSRPKARCHARRETPSTDARESRTAFRTPCR